MASAGSSALGIGAIGFGTLMIYSAYTGKPLFGEKGLIRQYLTTGSVEGAGKGVGKILTDLQKSYGYTSELTQRPINEKPPGA